jgi:hypothetical protein
LHPGNNLMTQASTRKFNTTTKNVSSPENTLLSGMSQRDLAYIS